MEDLMKLYGEFSELVDEITTYFYQQNIKKGFTKTDDLLVSIMNLLDAISNYQIINSVNLVNENKVNQYLTKIMLAIEKKDIILLSDILRYEFAEYIYAGLKLDNE